MPLRDLFIAKIAESKRINEELKGLRTLFNDKKNLIEDLVFYFLFFIGIKPLLLIFPGKIACESSKI